MFFRKLGTSNKDYIKIKEDGNSHRSYQALWRHRNHSETDEC